SSSAGSVVWQRARYDIDIASQPGAGWTTIGKDDQLARRGAGPWRAAKRPARVLGMQRLQQRRRPRERRALMVAILDLTGCVWNAERWTAPPTLRTSSG